MQSTVVYIAHILFCIMSAALELMIMHDILKLALYCAHTDYDVPYLCFFQGGWPNLPCSRSMQTISDLCLERTRDPHYHGYAMALFIGPYHIPWHLITLYYYNLKPKAVIVWSLVWWLFYLIIFGDYSTVKIVLVHFWLHFHVHVIKWSEEICEIMKSWNKIGG